MLSDEQIQTYLADIEAKLINGNRLNVELSNDWISKFPEEPGIYIAWENGSNDPVYVGKTGNIMGRMRDLLDSRHHNLRRKIGSHNFSHETGYKKADSKSKFPPHIEQKVESWLKQKIRISALPLKLGRKELEEKIIQKYDPKYNEKGQRMSS